MRKLTLISRSYCHLCEDMQAALESLQVGLPFNFDIIDVDGRPELEARYGEWVPVLLDGEVEICHYSLDEAKLAAHLERKSV